MAEKQNDKELAEFTEDRVDEVSLVFENLAAQLALLTAVALTSELTLKKKRETLSKMDILIDSTVETTVMLLNEILAESYLFGIKQVNDLVPELSKANPLGLVHNAQIRVLLDDAFLDFGTGLQGARKSANTILSRALQEQIRGRIVEGVVVGTEIPETARRVLEQIRKQGFTTFIRRDGRSINLKAYSEMLTRTHVIRAANEGTLTRANELGITIFQMSTHPGTKDAACLDVEGKLFDTTGKRFPIPPRMPIHPNCRHVLLARPDL